MTALPVLRALLGHWRRHPLELATLLLGLALATALWSGVQALNAEARASYARAEAVGGGDVLASVVAADRSRLPVADFVALRRAGWPVSPVLEGDLRRGDTSLRIIGIDPLTLPAEATALQVDADEDGRLTAFVRPPWLALAAPGTADRLADDRLLPPLEASETLPPETLVMDIAAAEALLGAEGRVSRLLLPPEAAGPLPAGLAGRLEVVPPDAESDLDRLTDSFHLNLTAFGFLSFVVGLFIVYSAIGLAFEQRRPMLRTLRAVGVSARMLTGVMMAELLALAAVAGLAGIAIGYAGAAALLPDVAASLGGLYGARVSGSLTLQPAWWLSGLAISLAGAFAAAATSLWRAWHMPVLAPAQPQAWLAAQRRGLRLQAAGAAVLGAVALWLALTSDGLTAGFALMGAVLLAAALLLPPLLALVLALGARRARRPVVQWAWADGRQQMGGLSLALMALLLALGVNVGVGTMVDSFRQTFLGYLDQRLAAEVYIDAVDAEGARAVSTWLEGRPEVDAVLPIWNADTRVADWPVEVFGFRDHATYRDSWPLLAALPDGWDRVAGGEAVLVSEQLARRLGIRPGAALTLPTPAGPWQVIAAAIYSDYGNPAGQVMVTLDVLGARWPEADRSGLAVRVAPAAAPALIAALRPQLPEGGQIVDQRGLKDLSERVFERTFAVTVALNALTLAVAGIALLTSLLTLSNLRLMQLAPLWAVGLTRRQLSWIELGKTLALAGLTALAAVPLGLAVAWVLTNVINVQAFGWQLPIFLFPGKWATLVALAVATALLAALWPVWRLRRASPLLLLQGFSNER